MSKPTVADLTKNELVVMATQLEGTQANVYRVLKSRFMIEGAAEAIFDRLEHEAGLFKCESCDVWKVVAAQDKDVKGHCVGCVDAMDDGDDPEDEE